MMRALLVLGITFASACCAPTTPAPRSPATASSSHRVGFGPVPGGGFIPPTLPGGGTGGGGGGGTVTSVTAGTGLTGGTITTTGTIALDPTAVQVPVTGTCLDPFGIDTINSDGTVVCSTTTIGGTLTTSDLLVASGAHGATNYAGTGSVADKALSALSATGAGTFSYFYDSPGTGLATGVTGNIVKLADTAITPGTYALPGSITFDQQGRATAASAYAGSDPGACAAGSADAHPALSATGTLTKSCSVFVNAAGTMLSLSGSTLNLADIATATVIGRVAAGTGAPSALTTTQLTTLVNTFSSTLSGAVPASGGGTTTYLRADGSFATPPGTGVTSVATGTGLTGGTITTTGTLSLNINAGVTQTATAGQAWTSMTSAGILSSSVFVNAAGTGLVLTGSSLSVGLNGNASQACGAGNAVTGLSAAGIESCNTLATLGAAAGTGTANTTTKWSNTSGGLTNAWATEDGTTWGVASKFTIAEASGNFRTFGTGTIDGAATLSSTLGVTGLTTMTGGFNAAAAGKIDSGATPAAAQFTAKANSLGVLSLLDYAVDNVQIGFDEEWIGSTETARSTTVAAIKKTASGNLSIYGKTGATLNAAVTPTDYLDIALGTGNVSILAGTLDMGSHKITSLANGTAGTDAAAFGQLATAVNAAVSGVAGRVGVFNGTNTMTGYSGFTSDASGNVNATTLTASGNIGTTGGDLVIVRASGSQPQLQWQQTGQSTWIAYEPASGSDWRLFSGGTDWFKINSSLATVATALTATGALTASSTAHIVGALMEDSTSLFSDTSTMSRLVGTSTYLTPNLILQDGTTEAAGIGGELVFRGAYTGTTTTNGGSIKLSKSNSVDGDFGFDLEISTRQNGDLRGVIPPTLLISGTGVTTMLGQGFGVGGLYEGQAKDVADVTNSGTIRLNFAKYTDVLDNAAHVSQAQTTTGNNLGWGTGGSGNTIAYTEPVAVNSPWYPSTITPTATAAFEGKLVCTSGATNCTAGGADWRTVMTSTSSGVTDLRSTTITFSVWVQPVSGSFASQIALGRYNDNEQTYTACPSATAGTWTRCSATKTFSATSYTDNSELRAYIQPLSTTGLYIAGAQIQLGSVYTPYEPVDVNNGRGSELYVGYGTSISAPSYTTGSSATGDSAQGAWTNSLGVGYSKEDPLASIASDGTIFSSRYVTSRNTGGANGFIATDATVRAFLVGNSSSGWVGTSTNHQFQIQTNGVTAITIDTSQNVTIAGTTTSTGAITASSTKNKGTITLSSGSGTATVTSGAQCACSDTTSESAVKCTVATTTLTAKGLGSDVVSYVCL